VDIRISGYQEKPFFDSPWSPDVLMSCTLVAWSPDSLSCVDIRISNFSVHPNLLRKIKKSGTIRLNLVSAGVLGYVHGIVSRFYKPLQVEILLKFSQTDAHRDLLESGLFDR